MDNKQYTQEEIFELLNNPEKANQFKEQYQKEIETKKETTEVRNTIFTKEEDIVEPCKELIDTEEETNEHSTLYNPYVEYEFSKNGSLMPLDNNGFDGMSNEEFMQLVNEPFTPEGSYSIPHATNNPIFSPFYQKPELNKEEREILEITAQPGFMDMLREEFEKNPIDYEQAQAELEGRMLSEAQSQLRQINNLNG